jgi:glycosyltransferase involved in cell wall biosynthesis
MKEHVVGLSAGLRAAGHDVEVAAPRDSDVADAARAKGLRVHAIPLVGPLHPLHDPVAILAVRKIVRSGRFDIVHAHGFKAGFVGRLGAKLGGAKVFIVTAHNHVLFRDDTPASVKSRYRLVERALASLVTHYIAVSESIRRELVEGYKLPADKVTTIHNGIDPAPFLAPQDRQSARAELDLPSPDAIVVGVAARFSAQKGLRHLIAAMPELRAAVRSDGGELVVVVGGSGPLENDLREQAAALGMSDALRWPGHVASMPRLLSSLDVYVSPAETEALGIGLIEAAIAGVPTVATNVGGVPEVVIDGETGLLVVPSNSHALANAVLELVRDRQRASALSVAARERCLREFASERMIERTLDVYAESLGDTPSEHNE